MLQTTPPELPRPTDPVEQPIINSPFHPPQYHWDLDTSAKALPNSLPGRRISQDIPPVAGNKKMQGRISLLLPGQYGAVWKPLELVNDIRERVLEWKKKNYQGITPISRELIDHWTNPEACQLYFAQLDAIRTHIYLHEVAPPEIREELHRIDHKYNEGIHRIAHKMATATGKTPVMAMLIMYHAANQNAAPDDQRFGRRFLVITPGLTVKERLQDSLNPGHEDNDWTAFSLTPPGDRWERALTSASINIINYHQMEPKQIISIGSKQQDIQDGGSNPPTEAERETRAENIQDVIDRIADGRSQQGRILVINDEGHHCHRGDPDAGKAQKETEWFDGIRRIQGLNLLHYVTDMSATPIFLTQASPRPFDWIVSDYSLVDAIEAGLTKIPRVPTHTNLKDEAEFRDIFGSTDSKQTANFQPETTGNNPILKRAMRALCDDYEKIHSERSARPIGEQPVIAIVMNSVKNANAMYRYIAGGSVSPLLGNFADPLNTEVKPDPHTIIVHSKLEDGEEATLIGVCKGFSGGCVAGDFQVGLVFGPGFGQQPDPVPEPALVHQTAQPIDAAPEYADLPFRLLPTVAMLGSKRLGRRPQVAWGDPAVMGVFRPGAVGQGQERRHRKHQPVAGDAGGVGPSGLVPLPAHALDGLEAQFDPEAESVPTHSHCFRRQVGEDYPGFLLLGVPDHQQGAAALGLGGAEGGAPSDPGRVGNGNEASRGQSFAAVGAEGDVIPVAHTGVPALGAYLLPQLGAGYAPVAEHDDGHFPGNGWGQFPEQFHGGVHPGAFLGGAVDAPGHGNGAAPVEDADDDGGGLVALESRIDGHCQPAGHPPGEHPPEQRCEAEGYVQLGLAGACPVAAVVEPLAEILAEVVPAAPWGEGGGHGVLAGAAGENGPADPQDQTGQLWLGEVR